MYTFAYMTAYEYLYPSGQRKLAILATFYGIYEREIDAFLHELIEPTTLQRKNESLTIAENIFLNPN